MTDNNHKSYTETLFIPLKPGLKLRRISMISLLIPGIVLIVAAVLSPSLTVGELLLRVFSAAAGMIVMYTSFIEFRQPGTVKWMSIDTMMIYSGLLILVQGTMIFNPYVGIQIAHLFFIVSVLSIFKGVMYPDSRLIRGFLISKDDIKFKLWHFAKTSTVLKTQVEKITLIKNTLNFHLNDKTIHNVDLSDYEQNENVIKELNDALHEDNES